MSSGCYERLAWATALAERLGGAVSLLHVIEPTPLAGGFRDVPTALEEEAMQHAQGRLRRCLERRVPQGVRGQAMVRRGRLVEQIVAAAGQMETDLLLLGRARRWGWERLLARNRVRAIVREASCPALVIPEVFATRHGPGLREGVVVIGRRVLVPVDGSELSREAVRWGAALAEPAEGRLIVFHVAGLHSEGQGSAAIGPEIFRAVTAEALEQRLWAWAQAIVPSMAQVHALQETGVAGWDVLVAVAARERCDLIVVCSHTVQAWRRLLGGCLAEQLVAGSSCPVLCLPEGSVKQASAAARIAQTP